MTTTQTFDGTLDITIKDAQLMIPQHASKQDPYCIVTLGSSGLQKLMEGETFGKEKFQTKVHNGAGQHPVWNETHSLSMKNMKLDSHLKVKVYDKDFGKDDFLGVTRVDLSELMKFDNKGLQYFPLYKEDMVGKETETIGKVGVAVKFNCTQCPQVQGDVKSGTTTGVGTGTGFGTGTTTGVGIGPTTDVGTTTGTTTGVGIGPTTDVGTTTGTTTGTTGMGAMGPGTSAMGATDTTGVNQVTTFNGTIDITISEAKILEIQRGSKQDPYCIVALGSGGLKSVMEGEHLGKEKFKTKVHNGAGQHPIWNETHSLSLKNMKFDSELEVRLYDKDMIKDDYIGIARMCLGDLLQYNQKGLQFYPLYKKGALHQTKNEQIGQIGVGVVFNCTDMPQAQAGMQSQVRDTMARKYDQRGVGDPYQTAAIQQGEMGSDLGEQQGRTDWSTKQQQAVKQDTKPVRTQQGATVHAGQETVNQPLDTKPVRTEGTEIPSNQAQTYGH